MIMGDRSREKIESQVLMVENDKEKRAKVTKSKSCKLMVLGSSLGFIA